MLKVHVGAKRPLLVTLSLYLCQRFPSANDLKHVDQDQQLNSEQSSKQFVYLLSLVCESHRDSQKTFDLFHNRLGELLDELRSVLMKIQNLTLLLLENTKTFSFKLSADVSLPLFVHFCSDPQASQP